MNHNAEQFMNELPGYRWWKRSRRFRILRTFLWIVAILVLVTTVLLMIGFENATRTEAVVSVVTLLFLAAYALFLLLQILRSFFWKPDACWFGIITDTCRIRLPNKHVKEYRIIADVDGKVMEGICLSKTYYHAKKGQRVVLFTQGNDTVYCIHPDL